MAPSTRTISNLRLVAVGGVIASGLGMGYASLIDGRLPVGATVGFMIGAILIALELFVIQGRNDPRVVVGESDSLVEDLRSKGKDIEYLVFDDEGHDMVKHENKVEAYVRIVDFFADKLG